ncbi:MAG: protoporphyrinogen oxidase, partial [Myxococcota bacterium]
DGALARELMAIPYAAVSVVALGWKPAQLGRALDGFGFLIPSGEGRRILGTLWDSSVFVGRAPDGYVLTRTIVGGARHRELAMLPPDELVATVREELREILDVRAAPEFVDVVRHERAIPQYVPGHAERLLAIEGRLTQHRGLYLTGNAYRGVALPECTARAPRIAAEVLGT